MTFAVMLAVPAVALASTVDVASVVDVTNPTGAVTLQPSQSENITINMAVTGNQAGTATFEVNQDWVLQSNGTFAGSNPKEFTVPPQSGGTTTNFSTTGKVSVANDVAASTTPHTLTISVFDITNSNTSGAKLEAGKSATYSVTVASPPPPADTTAPQVTAIARADANPTNTTGNLSWDVTFSESVTGVDATDFNLVNAAVPGSPAITGVSGSGANYTVTASSGSGSGSGGGGTLRLDLVDDNTIKDGANNVLVGASSADGGFSGEVYLIDRVAPTMTGSAVLGPDFTDPYTAGNWTNQSVRVTFTCAETGHLGSGLTGTSGNNVQNFTTETDASGTTATSGGTCADNAGNTAAAANFGPIKIDKTDPIVALNGGPANGQSYFFGDTPAAPTCDASDDLSDLNAAGCVVSGYSSAVGTHTVTASATDNAGNENSASSTYTVKPYTLNGFYQPIDMNETVNTVKNGSTVPVKFELFKGATELTSTSAVTSISARQVSCAAFNGDPTDEIEYLAPTGGTSLRYDATAGQFIYNWATPKKATTCYNLTMTAADGSPLTAYFKLR